MTWPFLLSTLNSPGNDPEEFLILKSANRLYWKYKKVA